MRRWKGMESKTLTIYINFQSWKGSLTEGGCYTSAYADEGVGSEFWLEDDPACSASPADVRPDFRNASNPLILLYPGIFTFVGIRRILLFGNWCSFSLRTFNLCRIRRTQFDPLISSTTQRHKATAAARKARMVISCGLTWKSLKVNMNTADTKAMALWVHQVHANFWRKGKLSPPYHHDERKAIHDG